ncbi:MAG: hypothetical protein ACR2LK_13105 [Solirubrobacteraceae bacterium]
MSPLVLVVLIAWALLSVMFLTGTLLAARSIDRSVAVIKPNVDEIGTEANFIGEAKTVRDSTIKIRAAADPLTGHLARTLEVASKGIDPKLKSILGKVGEINSVAGEINGTVLSIGTTVDQIFGNASSINSSAKSIGSSGRSILSRAREINTSARSIQSSVGSILTRVNTIDRTVATIVARATAIDTTLKAVKVDFVGIDAGVGQEGRNGRFGSSVVGHANSIDCALAVSGKGCK